MSRRIIPGTFWSVILLCLVLLFTSGVNASRPNDLVPMIVGTWDGFFQQDGTTDAPGRVWSNIHHQVYRRIEGDAALHLEGGALFNAFNFQATVPRDDFVTGTGRALVGQVVFHAGLDTLAGGAGVMQQGLKFVPGRGSTNQFSSLLLHPFATADGPALTGLGTGTFQSDLDSSFRGELDVEFLSPVRGSFPGRMNFFPDSTQHSPFSWQCLATTSDSGQLVLIAQGRTGRIVADGVVVPSEEHESSSFVGGFYRLLRNDGRFDYGAYNFNLTPSLR